MAVGAGAAPLPLRVRLLGGFEVVVGDYVIPDAAWRTQKARSLFKIVCLAPARRLHREQVLDLLWPTLEPKAAANNLRTTLHDARRALGSAPMVSGAASPLRLIGNTLAIDPLEDLWIDVDAFEVAAAEANRARTPAAFRAAIDLYRGDLLPEDRYEDWTAICRDSLREAFIALLVGLARLYEGLQTREAIDLLQRVVGLEPAHEQAHVDLMRLYALSGQRSQALRQFERLRKALRDELDVEPEPLSEQLYGAILAGQFAAGAQPSVGPSPSPPAPENNLPSSVSSFVGREREIGRLREDLADSRLLTIVGPGGAGKTRLALEVARDVIDAYPDGVWFVELAGLVDSSDVPRTVASVLDVPEQLDRSPVDVLVDALRSKHSLVVLDNCEHVIDGCSGLAVALLGACPHLTIVATTREPLRVAGELAWRIPFLTVPDPGSPPTVEDVGRSAAVRLFVERARFLQPGFVLTAGNAAAVAEICRLVDGLPLAIELAAARVPALDIEQLAARLENTLQILTGGSRTADSRHQTLRATLDWSHDLLTEPERRAFERLAVFAGGWRLDAAEVVAAEDPGDTPTVLDLLAKLVDKSLVLTTLDPEGRLRYRFLEPVRQYARERLDARGEAEAAHLRHARLFLSLSEDAEMGLRGADQAAWLTRLEAERDNLRAALRWALDGDVELAVRLGSALWRFWYIHGHLIEGTEWLQRVLAQSASLPPDLRAQALTAAGSIAWSRGDFDEAVTLGEESLALLRGRADDIRVLRDTLALLGTTRMSQGDFSAARRHSEENLMLERAAADAWGIGRSLGNLAQVAFTQGDYEAAETYWQECLDIKRAADDPRGVAIAIHNLGEAARAHDDLSGAQARYRESLALFRQLDFRLGAATALTNLAEAQMELGDDDSARQFLLEALAVAKELANPSVAAYALEITGKRAARRGQTERAARLFGAADVLRESVGEPRSVIERAKLEPWYDSARDQPDELVVRAWTTGRSMTLEQALDDALEMQEPETRPDHGHKGPWASPEVLTRREREIVALIADGLTNRQIAASLGTARPTADKHVSNIMRKLTLASRADVRRWAIEHGMANGTTPTHM